MCQLKRKIYNFEKGLKDDGNDWTGFPQIDLKEDSQCIYICGISETDRWHLFYYTLTKINCYSIAHLHIIEWEIIWFFLNIVNGWNCKWGIQSMIWFFWMEFNFWESWSRVQEYWMQRFKESKKRNKLFIVYSDCLPEDLKNMPESVVEFFESGIVVQLKSSKG